jgi:ABC-type glycerol-3-phosphate transport system substrate-binding protein
MHCATNHGRMAAHPLSRRGVLMAGGTPAMLLMATAACLRRSGEGTQPEQPVFKVGSRPAELRLHVRSGAEQDTLEERLPIFEQQFKGVTVKIEDFPGGEYQAKIVALFAGNALGDVLWGGNAQSQSLLWAHMGGLRAVDDLVRTDKLDLGQYYKASVDGGKLDGKLFGLPFKLHPSFCILYHNASAVREAGAVSPDANTTWEQLIELGKRLQRSEGGQVARWGLLVPAGGQPMQFFACWARSWGTEVYDEQGKRALLDDPRFQQAMQFIHDLMFKHQVSPTPEQLGKLGGTDNAFLAGSVGLFQGASSQKGLLPRVQGRFEMANSLIPKGPAGVRGSIAISDYIHVSTQSRFVPEGWELTKFLTDRETGIRLGEGRGGASGTCGARPDVYRSERLLANPLHRVVADAVDQVMPFRNAWNFRGAEAERAMYTKLNELWNGTAAPTTAFFKDLNSLVQVVLDQPR